LKKTVAFDDEIENQLLQENRDVKSEEISKGSHSDSQEETVDPPGDATPAGPSDEEESSEEEINVRAKTNKKKLKKQIKKPNYGKPTLYIDDEEEEEQKPIETEQAEPELEPEPTQQTPKKKRRRANKQQDAGPAVSPDTSKAQPTKGQPQQKGKAQQNKVVDIDNDETKCGKCGATFKTRNLLFNHIKKTGHALPK